MHDGIRTTVCKSTVRSTSVAVRAMVFSFFVQLVLQSCCYATLEKFVAALREELEKVETTSTSHLCTGLHAAAKFAIFHVTCDFSQFFVMLMISRKPVT